MANFYDRLQQTCRDKGITVTSLCKSIGVGTANGTYWKKGSIPSGDVLIQISEFLGTSIDYLLKGYSINYSVDDMHLLNSLKQIDARGKSIVKAVIAQELQWSPKEQRKALPFYKLSELAGLDAAGADPPEAKPTRVIHLYEQPASAGTGQFVDSEEYKSLEVASDQLPNDATFSVPVAGDSMLPEYASGDILLVRKQDTLENGDLGIFNINGESFFKKMLRTLDEEHRPISRLISLNPDYDPIDLSEQDTVKIVGKVLGKL